MTIDRKKLTYIAAAVLFVVATIIVTVFILKSLSIDTNNKGQNTSKDSVAALKTQAGKALKDGKTNQAKGLYKELKQKYADTNNTNGIAEVDGILYQIDHPSITPKPATVTNPTSGSRKN